MAVTPREVEDFVVYQIGALAAIAAAEGVRLRHVKAHGALYNMAVTDRALADAIAAAVRAVDRAPDSLRAAGNGAVAPRRKPRPPGRARRASPIARTRPTAR